MIFPKEIALKYDLSCIIRKDYISFSENIILFFEGKMKDDLSQKIDGNMIFSSNAPKRWSFQKEIALEYDLSCIIWKGVFFPGKYIFFFGRKMEDDLSHEIHGNMMFSIYMYKCYKYDIPPKKHT